MRILAVFLIVLCLPLLSSLEASSAKGKYYYSLKDYRQAGRQVLLVFAPSKESKSFQAQLEAFVNKDKFYRNAKTAIFYVFEDGSGRADDMVLRNVDAQDLRRFFKTKKGVFEMRLLDRKGKTKWKKSAPVDIEALKGLL